MVGGGGGVLHLGFQPGVGFNELKAPAEAGVEMTVHIVHAAEPAPLRTAAARDVVAARVLLDHLLAAEAGFYQRALGLEPFGDAGIELLSVARDAGVEGLHTGDTEEKTAVGALTAIVARGLGVETGPSAGRVGAPQGGNVLEHRQHHEAQILLEHIGPHELLDVVLQGRSSAARGGTGDLMNLARGDERQEMSAQTRSAIQVRSTGRKTVHDIRTIKIETNGAFNCNGLRG